MNLLVQHKPTEEIREDRFLRDEGFPDDLEHNTVSSQVLITGARKQVVARRIKLKMLQYIFERYRNPITSVKVLQRIFQLKKRVGRNYGLKKFALVDGNYYWDLYTPGFPSKSFKRFVQSEANRMLPQNKPCNRFLNVIIGITNKCSYKCEHCYEWDFLNKKPDLSLNELKKIVTRFQKLGTALIHFSGGEPMLRVDDMIELLRSADHASQFWIATSGYHLNQSNAQKLKDAGLTGVSISLDHYEASKHNAFRGYKHAYEWALKAVQSAINANLVTGLSWCVSKDLVNEKDLMTYMQMARKLGVSLVQILEPKSVGHYQSKEVELTSAQLELLENFFLKMNFDDEYKNYPIILYHGYHQRRVGCFAAGDRVIYVDTNGDINPCPFCKNKVSNALAPGFEKGIEMLKKQGCEKYQAVSP